MGLTNNNNLAKVGRAYSMMQTVMSICIGSCMLSSGIALMLSDKPLKNKDGEETNPKYLGGALILIACCIIVFSVMWKKLTNKNPAAAKIGLGLGALGALT